MKQDRNDNYYQQKESGFSSGLFWGLVFGAVGMFLFATKEGKKLRNYLSEHGEKILSEFEEISQEKGVDKKIKRLALSESFKKSVKKEENGTKELSHIAKLQERGRQVAHRFFTRSGRSLGK